MSNFGQKIGKKLLILAGVLLGLVVIGLTVVYFMLNGIVRSTVESSATSSLKVNTKLAGASVAPFSGDVSLTDFRIASPKGFAAPEMFSLGGIDVNVSYGELFGKPVKVATIRVDKPRLILEHANGKFNYLVLMDNLKSPSPAPDSAKTEPLKLVINEININNTEVELRPGIPGLEKPIVITLPSISMRNIGNADGTQTGEEVGRVVMEIIDALAKQAAESEQVPREVRELLKLDLNKIADDLGKKANQEVEKAVDKAGKQLGKEIDKLFNKKDK